MAHGTPAPLLDWARWNGRKERTSATSESGRLPIWERYQRFMKDNPAVLEEALNLARAELAAGAKRIGAKALWERLRGRMRVKTGRKFKLDNDYTALLARDLITAEPKLAGKIELRERKTAIDKAVDKTTPIVRHNGTEHVLVHIASIAVDLESVRRGGSCRTAVCTCGWVGPERATLEMAADDAMEHENVKRGGR